MSQGRTATRWGSPTESTHPCFPCQMHSSPFEGRMYATFKGCPGPTRFKQPLTKTCLEHCTGQSQQTRQSTGMVHNGTFMAQPHTQLAHSNRNNPSPTNLPDSFNTRATVLITITMRRSPLVTQKLWQRALTENASHISQLYTIINISSLACATPRRAPGCYDPTKIL